MVNGGMIRRGRWIINITDIAHDMPYQTVGNLLLSFPGHVRYSRLYRELDLDSAVATTTYDVDGVSFKREGSCSLADGVIVFHVSASKPGMITFLASMDSPQMSTASIKGGTWIPEQAICMILLLKLAQPTGFLPSRSDSCTFHPATAVDPFPGCRHWGGSP